MLSDAAPALAACSTSICQPETGPSCTIGPRTYELDEGCELDFSRRDVTVSGGATLKTAVSEADLVIRAGSLSMNGLIDAPAGYVEIYVAGQFRLFTADNKSGRILMNAALDEYNDRVNGDLAITAGSVEVADKSFIKVVGGDVDICAGTRPEITCVPGPGLVVITSNPNNPSVSVSGTVADAGSVTIAGGSVTLGSAAVISANGDYADVTISGAGPVDISGKIVSNGVTPGGDGGEIKVETRGNNSLTVSGTLRAQGVGAGYDGVITVGPACSVTISGTVDTKGGEDDGVNTIIHRNGGLVISGTIQAGADPDPEWGGNKIVCKGSSGQCEGSQTFNGSTITPAAEFSVDPTIGPCVECVGNSACDDGKPCTNDICSTGTCVYTGNISGSCDDGNQCTQNDTCSSGGSCSGDLITGSCDDGNLCTLNDNCSAGFCSGTPRNDCDDGSVCTSDSCNPSIGCVNTPLANGSPCPDGDACNGYETCQSGSCTPGTPPNCVDPDPCTIDTCDPVAGCVNSPGPDGTPCGEDGNVCNGPETCQSGICTSGPPPACDDSNVCTTDSCNPATGCQNTPVGDGTSCADQNLCNGNETCQAGVCTPGAPLDCVDGNDCTTDSCNSATGCQNTPVADATPCEDGNVCNGDETCQVGLCTPGAPRTCDDEEVCTIDSCNPATGCQNMPVVDGTSCGDGNVCNGDETCQIGLCTPGTPLTCDDGEVCTDDGCDPVSGCQHMPNTAFCNDGNACTAPDICNSGVCVGGPPPICDDNEVCTADSCDPAMGCVYTPITGSCDDGDPCTTADTCSSGQCLGESLCGDGVVDASCGEECDDGDTDPGDGCSPTCQNEGPCDCCTAGLEVLSFETGIGSGSCGTISGFKCSNDPFATCVDAADCDFGFCFDPPGVCLGNLDATCSGDGTPCTGACEQQFTAALPSDLDCGSLYMGGGQSAASMPIAFPDKTKIFMKVESCDTATGELTLGPTTAAETGSMDTCTAAGCLFGPPLPIAVPFDIFSACVVSTLSTDAIGTTHCRGDTSLSLSLASSVYFTDDVLPGVPGQQPCPLCSRVCQGGASDGLPCKDNADCDLNVCGSSPVCLGGANDGGACTPATSNLGEAYPVSRDCLPDPDLDITAPIGGVPINLVLTSGTADLNAVDLPGVDGKGTFCGFCRDNATFDYTLTPCTTDAQCAATEHCSQKHSGAFGVTAATRISLSGSTDGRCVADGGLHTTDLVGIFCAPPTLVTGFDNVHSLPGPGAALLQGAMRLSPSVGCGNGLLEAGEACDDGNAVGGDCCSPACQFEASGLACSDQNPCTVGDMCDSAGSCLPGACDTGRTCGAACLAVMTCQEPTPGECVCAAQ